MQSKTGSMQILFCPWQGDPPSDAPPDELLEVEKPESGKLNGGNMSPLSGVCVGGVDVSSCNEASSPGVVGPPSSPGAHALHPPLLVPPLLV